MKKLLIFLIVVLLASQVIAGEDDKQDTSWVNGILDSLSDLGNSITDGISSLPQKILEFVVYVINLPLQPLLYLVKKLLSDEVKIDSLKGIWSIIVYILSLLYGLLFIFAGVNFMTSGNNAERREKAKEWFQNTILMIIFVQVSFFIYNLFLTFAGILTKGIMNMIGDSFFVFTADNFANLGLDLFFSLSYVIALLITVIILAIRYLLVFFGAVVFPIAIFLYFFPPAKHYGKLILNLIVVAAIMPFANSLILLMGYKLLEVESFSNVKILVMIASFFLVIVVNIMMLSFIISKSSQVLPKGSTKLLTMPIKGL